MTLTTHAIVGTAAMSATISGVGVTPAGLTLGFGAAFASHFIIDAIPHWNESDALLRSIRYNESNPLDTDVIIGEDKFRDLAIISTDGLLGLCLSIFIFSVWLFHVPLPVVFLGATAGELPDALQFFYFKTRLKIMEPLQLFHHSLQTEYSGLPFLGIEAVLVVIVVAGLKFFI